MTTLENIIYPTQKKLFSYLKKQFHKNTVSVKGKYILVKGTAPIMLVAHLDTVHMNPVKIICKNRDGSVWMSPEGIGGDDRCGVYGILKVYESAKVKPWLLFTCDEEIGCVGAGVFADDLARRNYLPKDLKKIKCIIEIDRRGSNDAVFYGCDNTDFEAYVNSKGFKTAIGSFATSRRSSVLRLLISRRAITMRIRNTSSSLFLSWNGLLKRSSRWLRKALMTPFPVTNTSKRKRR